MDVHRIGPGSWAASSSSSHVVVGIKGSRTPGSERGGLVCCLFWFARGIKRRGKQRTLIWDMPELAKTGQQQDLCSAQSRRRFLLCAACPVWLRKVHTDTELEVVTGCFPLVRPQPTGHWPLVTGSPQPEALPRLGIPGASAPKRHLLRSRASPKRARLPAGDLLIAGPGFVGAPHRCIAACCMPGGAPPLLNLGGQGIQWRDALGCPGGANKDKAEIARRRAHHQATARPLPQRRVLSALPTPCARC